MTMDINDYARLRDVIDTTRKGSEFVRVGTSPTRLQGSNPSKAKARLYGTNGKLGVNGPIGTTASQGTLRDSRSAELNALARSDRVSVAVVELLSGYGVNV